MSTPIQNLFAQVPSTYERINHLLTWNFDKHWRRSAVKWVIEDGGIILKNLS
ncbi:hypothetical protein KAR48_00115 [bacterium]|nr:hypothetical protein [bacterium]